MNNYNYLKEIRYAFYTKMIPKKVFIIGNISCDIDSNLSAYLLSIGKNIREETVIIDDSNCVSLNNNAKILYLPVINCKRGELISRLDCAYVFEKFRLNQEDFFYIDDIEVSEKTFKNSKGQNEVILVDHSNLGPDIKYLSPYVTEVFDHHYTLEIEHPNLRKKFIKYPLGSCTTLILIDFFLNKFPHSILPPLLAVTAILLDTENFNPKYYYNRWTEMDRMVYDHIISEIQSNIDLESYYNEILKAKTDIERNLSLGVKLLMEKDRKKFKWGKYYTEWSSLTISLHKIVERFGMEKVIEYIEEECKNGKDYFLMNSLIENGNKEFIVYDVKGDINFEEFKKYLEEHSKLKIEKMYQKEKVIYIEFEYKASRKATEPFFNEYFSSK